MIRDLKKIKFPEYARITDVSVSLLDMGDRTITLTIKVDGSIAPDFSEDWIIEFKGERYIHSARKPQGTKDNSALSATYNLTFRHEAIIELQRYYFVEMASTETGTVIPDKYDVPLGLTLPNFIIAFNNVLNYYFNGKIKAVLNSDWEASEVPSYVEINYSYIWDVLQKVYDIYNVRWVIERADAESDNYLIKFGYPAKDATHVFEYGYNGGLLKVERQVQSTDIKNIILGRGGDQNLPYRYFKAKDPNNPNYAADPDAIPELQNIYFTELRSAEFRSYVQGWAYKHHGGKVNITNTAVDWAWTKGYTDEKFDPVEYVKDDASIAEYGELWGALDNNEEIYPSMEGLDDDIIAVDEITDDGSGSSSGEEEGGGGSPSDPLSETISGVDLEIGDMAKADTHYQPPRVTTRSFTWESEDFTIPENMEGTVTFGTVTLKATGISTTMELKDGAFQKTSVLNGGIEKKLDCTVNLFIKNRNTGMTPNPASLLPGTYYVTFSGGFKNSSEQDVKNVHAVLATSSIVRKAAPSEGGGGGGSEETNVFHIWIKNIWNTQKQDGETNEAYAERVWVPILGTDSEEASVSFRTGLLSVSDYNFRIVHTSKDEAVVFDESKTNTAGEKSHWRLTLERSDAEYEATGKLLPNSQINAKEGDRFYFTGIELPFEYVYSAELRLHNYKQDRLLLVKDIQPTWVVSIDKVRANNLKDEEIEPIVSQLQVGAKIRLRDKRFMPDVEPYVEQYVQSVTYSWKEPSTNNLYIYPDIEVVLSDDVVASQNPVETLSGKVDALERQIGSSGIGVSNLQQLIRAIGDRMFLRKDRDDMTNFLISFFGGAVFGNQGFASGPTGFGARIDRNGVGEMEALTLRRFLEVPELRFNRAEIVLGDKWRSPGAGIIESVEIDYDADGNVLTSGTITLKLQEGEIGAVAEDDICMGYYHNFELPWENAQEDVDDSKGNRMFAGFCTIYFRITEILDKGTNRRFKYVLREKSESWTHSFHPCDALHFVCYGNFTKKDRQTSAYETRTYRRFLINVNNWEYTKEMIAMQDGDLSNLNVFGLQMEGYSAYLNNIYMTGTIAQLAIDAPARMEIDTEGDNFLAWGESMTCTCRVYKGWDEVTEKVTKWTVTRASGDEGDDKAWLLKDKVKNFKGTLVLSYKENDNDLGMNALVPSVLFHFTAEWTEESGKEEEANFTLEI